MDGGVPPDGIPSLDTDEVEFVRAQEADAQYLNETPGFDDPRVIGLLVDGHAYAIPHNILWWHEILNLDLPDGGQVAVTYCPLTGSSLVFDRSVVDGAGLGVSGLLFQNNMVMFDRREPRSLWPQMKRGARCGAADGTELPMVGAVETTWSGWRDLHPQTYVVSEDTGIPRSYRQYPYGTYEQNSDLLFPMDDLDRRRPMKERVLGLPGEDGAGAIALPFGELRVAAGGGGGTLVVPLEYQGEEIVVFWETSVDGAMAFRPDLDGQSLTFQVEGGEIRDEETGSRWRMDGVARDGELAGAALTPVDEAYVAFWFAWAAFHPDTDLWTP